MQVNDKKKLENQLAYRLGLVGRIHSLCIQINQKTDKVAFYRLSGHVSAMNVEVAHSKEDYTVRLYSSSNVYYADFDSDAYTHEYMVKELKSVISELEKFLT